MPRVKQRHPPQVRSLLRHLIQQPPPERIGRRPTAGIRALRKFGRTFIDTFPEKYVRKDGRSVKFTINGDVYESGIGIMITIPNPRTPGYGINCASIKLGFEAEALVIEAIHGIPGTTDRIKYANETLGKPWANYALELAEQHARQCGLQRVKIASPQTNYWFNHPQVLKKVKDFEWEYVEVTDANEKEALQRQILGFYAIIAKKMKYKKQGDYYVKEL